MRLPIEYQEVAYITNTTGAYIDTGVVVKGGLGFELKAVFQEGKATNNEFFGGGVRYSDAIGICTHGAGTLGVYVGTTEVFTYPWYELHTIKVDTDGSAYKDGVKMGQSATMPSTTTNTMQIFRHSGTGVVQLEIVYLCKLFDSTGVLRDLVPCYRKSDNVVGMYDVQNDVFYTNASTYGGFIAGEIVDSDGPEEEKPTIIAGLGSIDLIRRNMMMAASADEKIIDAVKGGVSGDAVNDAKLMEVIYAQGWSKSPLYMTKKEAEKVYDIGQAFRNNNYIINFNAFEYFTSVTNIPSYALNSIRYLSAIKFPTSLSKINSNALESCINLTKIDLPDSLQQIGYRAFRATAITSLYIPDNVTFIDEGIIAHCQNVTSLVVSPNNTKYYSGEYNAIIEKDTHKFIMGCNTSTIPSDTKVIGKSAFNGIPITQIILPNGLEEIENSAFSQCKVTELIIPSSVRKIGNSAFWNNNFTSLILPDGLVRMESNLVSNSTNLTSITIPASVTFIGAACMRGCKNLKTINFLGTMSQWKNIQKGNNWKDNVPTDCVIYCTDGNLNITE